MDSVFLSTLIAQFYLKNALTCSFRNSTDKIKVCSIYDWGSQPTIVILGNYGWIIKSSCISPLSQGTSICLQGSECYAYKDALTWYYYFHRTLPGGLRKCVTEFSNTSSWVFTIADPKSGSTPTTITAMNSKLLSYISLTRNIGFCTWLHQSTKDVPQLVPCSLTAVNNVLFRLHHGQKR